MGKTLAVKFSDEQHAQATAVAQLEGRSLTELIRQSIDDYLDRKRESGELAERAQVVLDGIDQEAAARRATITGLLSGAGGSGGGKATRTTAKRR